MTETALRYELAKHSQTPGERESFSGYMLDCGEFTQELVRTLRGYQPPVITNAFAMEDRTGDGLLDAATGKHIKMWTVEIEDLQPPVATALVFWNSFSERLGNGVYTLGLRREHGQWIVVSEKVGLAL